jgi:hypothetical protein
MSYFNLHEKHFKDKICLFVPNKTSLLEPEQARHVGVVCKKFHHAQPEVSINYRNLMKVASSIFNVLQSRLPRSQMINGEFLWVYY